MQALQTEIQNGCYVLPKGTWTDAAHRVASHLNLNLNGAQERDDRTSCTVYGLCGPAHLESISQSSLLSTRTCVLLEN